MKKLLRIIPVVIIILSLVLSGIQGVTRLLTEQRQKDVQILVSYNDIKKASETYEKSFEEILAKLKEVGAGGILVKEQTIKSETRGSMASWEEQGEVTVFTGSELKLFGIMDGVNTDDINSTHYYLWIPKEPIRRIIQKHIENKIEEFSTVEINNQIFLDAGCSGNNILTLGTGYPMVDLEIIANQGLFISPQIRSWPNVTEEALEYVLKDVESIPNLGTVYFNDATVSGYDMPIMKEFAKNHKIGIVEFFSEKQKGLYSLLRDVSNGGENYNSIRLHTIADGETSTLTPTRVVDRYLLASTERNIKALLVKMPVTDQPNKDYEDWFKIINRINKGLMEEGYRITNNPEPINLPLSNPIIIWIIGLGPIFFLALFGRWVDKEKWSWILITVGLLIWTVILMIRPILARQLMALAGAILYPTWAVITCVSEKNKTWKEAFFTFLKVSMISLGGALSIIGLLSQTSSVLTIDIFRGSKVAHIIPIILVPILIHYKKRGLEAKKIKEVFLSPITYLTLLIMGVLTIAFIIYITRTGNQGPTSVYETMIRNLLDRILGVRPRTKEFLIGHPLMLMLLYYGYKGKYLPVLLGAVIGQISIVNTYAHIHTPILISLIRSFHGIWIGLIGGIVLIFIIKWIAKLGRRWGLWEV